MGVFNLGEALSWYEINNNLKYYKSKYTNDFIEKYNNYCNTKVNSQCFGEELEYAIFKVNNKYKKCKVSTDMESLINNINTYTINATTSWHPEYGDWMIEGVPLKPFRDIEDGVLNLEKILISRRKLLLSNLSLYELCPTLSFVPILCMNIKGVNGVSKSKYISDECIYPHRRFSSLTQNIRNKRGETVKIPINIYQDRLTTKKITTADAMAFGMGCCCLQVTLESKNMQDSLKLFDILLPLSPIMLL